MTKNVKTVERPVGEILRLAEKATKKEYVVEWHLELEGKELEKYDYIEGATVRVRALIGREWCVGKKLFQYDQDLDYWLTTFPHEGLSDREPKIEVAIDEDGHPYLVRRYGSEGFKYYTRFLIQRHHEAKFLGHYEDSFAIWVLRLVYNLVRKDAKHARFRTPFREWLGKKKQRAQELKEAALRKEYFGATRRKSKPEHDPAVGDLLEGKSEFDLFCRWYLGFVKEDYWKKIESSGKKRRKTFEKWVKKFTDRLKAAGFRLVKKHAIKD